MSTQKTPAPTLVNIDGTWHMVIPHPDGRRAHISLGTSSRAEAERQMRGLEATYRKAKTPDDVALVVEPGRRGSARFALKELPNRQTERETRRGHSRQVAQAIDEVERSFRQDRKARGAPTRTETKDKMRRAILATRFADELRAQSDAPLSGVDQEFALDVARAIDQMPVAELRRQRLDRNAFKTDSSTEDGMAASSDDEPAPSYWQTGVPV